MLVVPRWTVSPSARRLFWPAVAVLMGALSVFEWIVDDVAGRDWPLVVPGLLVAALLAVCRQLPCSTPLSRCG